jgi:hypothetical protein
VGAAEAERIAGEVGAIAARFPEDAAVQKEHAVALRCPAYAQYLGPSGVGAAEAERIAREVGAIAARFPEDAAIQKEHEEALRTAAYAQGQRPSGLVLGLKHEL